MTTSVSREFASITPRQLELLHFLANRHQMSVGDVAEALEVSSAAATKAITRLERKGLVTRAVDVMDRRCINVRLTRSGMEAARRSSGTD
jgi:DNA-binding MarR family transcriptional regulator